MLEGGAVGEIPQVTRTALGSPAVPADGSAGGSVILTWPEGPWANLEGSEGVQELGEGFRARWPEATNPARCEPKWNVMACGCRAVAYQSGCDRIRCAECEPKLRARRAASVRDRIEAGRGGKAAIYTVLTVPPERREGAADEATWTKWRRMIWRYLKREEGGLFAVERTDPCGDEAPGVWHPHLNLLWVQRDGFTPFVDVDALREEWRRITGAAAGRTNVWTRYSADPRRLGHWYWYMGRTWPAWAGSVKGHLTVRWLGKYPAKPPRDTTCRDCGQGFIFVMVGDKAAAEELAALGPDRVRWEWEKIEMERCFREADRCDK